MEVYRIEYYEDRLGPYRDFDDPEVQAFSDKLCDIHSGPLSATHPTPWLEKWIEPSKADKILCAPGYFFGFESLSQLKEWFTDDLLERLKELNFLLVKYTIRKTEVAKGKFQLIFIPQSASKSVELDWAEVL